LVAHIIYPEYFQTSMGTKTVASAEPRSVPASTHYGPDNPHPLSKLKTQLVWEGKYDEYGRPRAVDVIGAALPLQKIETIDEPRFMQQESHIEHLMFITWGATRGSGGRRNASKVRTLSIDALS